MAVASKKQPVSCGILLFRKHKGCKQFLLMEHARRWDLPKGHVDPGETEVECALREFEEETGINRKDIKLQKHFKFEDCYLVRNWKGYGVDVTKRLVIYLAKLKKGIKATVVPTEHIGYEWVDWNPPHDIQEKTINPLLREVDAFKRRKKKKKGSSS